MPDWRKLWSTNLLERVNEEIKRRTRVVGIFPNDSSTTRLVGSVLLEQDEHWQMEGRRMFSLDSMAAIPPSAEALPEPPGEGSYAIAHGRHSGPSQGSGTPPTGRAESLASGGRR